MDSRAKVRYHPHHRLTTEAIMTAQCLDGRAVAQEKMHALQAELKRFQADMSRTPVLAVVLVGDDAPSQVYVQRKREQCASVGMQSVNHDLPANIAETALLDLISQLNADDTVDGILVQLPLPKHIDTQKIIAAMDPMKDVDGFHPTNMGALATRHPILRPCTPWGIIQLLQHHNLLTSGMHAVVVGTSNIVGRPMALELLMANCTVTICHRATQDLAHWVKQAELLIVAIGQRHVIQSEWIQPGAIVVDVGIHRDAEGKIHGDVDHESAAKRASWLTPVPGGVGPMTVTTLLQNTLLAAQLRSR